jgi:hypothetical protein
VIGIGRILQVGVLELVNDEGHALEAVAAVAVAAVGEAADHAIEPPGRMLPAAYLAAPYAPQ